MFVKGEWFKIGWIYLAAMFVLEAVLPDWVGEENGIIENTQILWLFAGLYYCLRTKADALLDWGGSKKSLLYGGVIYFFLLIMREINWGRAILRHPDGRYYEYSDMGLYGQMVHPMVGILIILLLICLYRTRIWKFLAQVKIPARDFGLLLIFIFMSWVAEKANFTGYHGMVGEELAEFGAYMMMFKLLKDSIEKIKK